MNERETVTIDRDFYNELTKNYYEPPKKNDISTGLAILITLLVIAIIILMVWCFVLTTRLKEVENVLQQAGIVMQE